MDDPSARPVGWMLVTALGVVLLLDVGLPLVFRVSGPPTIANCSYVGFCAAQVGVHAALAVLMRGWLVARAASIFVLAALEAWALHRHDPIHERELFAYIFLVQWMLVAVAMLGMILTGRRLQRFSRRQLDDGIIVGPAQFSLRGLVFLVTAACVVAGLMIRIDWSDAIWAFALLFGGLFAFPMILLMPAALTAHRWMLWTILAAIVGGGSGTVAFFWMNRSWEGTPLFVVPCLLQVAVVLLMRRLGFRLTRPVKGLPNAVNDGLEAA